MLFIATIYVVGNVRMKYGASLILTGENRNALNAIPVPFFYQIFHTDSPEIEFDLHGERLATDGLNPISAINDRRLSA